MQLRTRITAALAASLFLIPLGAGLAQAVSWATVSVSWNGQTRASAYGSTYKSGSTARNDFRLNDRADDFNSSYGRSEFLFYSNGTYTSHGTLSTGEYTYSETPKTIPLSKPLVEAATKARTSSKVCVQLGFPVPDSCSNTSLATFSY